MNNQSFKQVFLIVILSVILDSPLFSQSISPERIFHIKESTVKISIEGSNNVGTGFFINSKGHILTCWHVIAPAIKIDSLTNLFIGFKKIFITLNNNEKLECVVPRVLVESYPDTLSYDICVLVPAQKHAPFPFLKLGNFNNVEEGQEVITCGYPLAIEQQFVTKGMVSTKYIDTPILNNGIKIPRNVALLDLTLNRGNSGGAIIAIGETINDDVVIGIADFIIIPIAGADELAEELKNHSGLLIMGIDPNLMLSKIMNTLGSSFNGISGCVSINHASYLLELAKKY